MFSCTSSDTPDAHLGCLCHRPEIRSLTRRIDIDLSRRGFVAGMAASIATLGLGGRARAQAAGAAPPPPVLFTNFRLFDGKSSSLQDGFRLLVDGSQIKSLVQGDLAAPEGSRTVDCGGRVIMPGLIDAHWHSLFAALSVQVLMSADVGYIFLAASAEAERTLMRGFTTIRDCGGPAFALKQAIDDGLTPGPRIYPSGAMITTSGGHGDLRPLSDVPRSPGGPVSATERIGGAIADSAAELQLRAREQLLQGASQLKVVGGGGVSSPRSPLDMSTFSESDLRTAVDVARDWNTYVTVHAYASNTVQRAIAAGAACIEHAHLMDDETARMMADKGIWLSIQPFLDADDSVPLTGPSQAKMLQVFSSTGSAYELAKKHRIKTAFGSDLLFSGRLAARQGTMLTHLARWYGNAEILTMATATNAELLGLSSLRNPYPGRLGVIEEGAFADLLLVDGDPLADIALVADPDKNFVMIMKDGKIYKDKISA